MAGPIGAAFAGIEIGTLASSVMIGTGLMISLFAGILMIVTKLYVKTKASESFVRTGGKGLLVVKDGGALVIPIIHRMTTVSLRTFKLEVKRRDEQALITENKLRCDIAAEFFVKVQPDEESIQAAARSFGDEMNGEFVKALVEEKLVDALRTVAATKTLEQLNSDRSEFMSEVTLMVSKDLKHNGLTLETATISSLDQTNTESLKDDNVFDAVGKRTIAAITQENLTERNRLEREGEQARKEQDVATRKKVLEFEQDQAEAEANQAAYVKQVEAQQNKEAEEARISSEKAVDVANVERAEVVALAQKTQEQHVQVAERTKQQAIEVADRKKQEAVTKAEQDVEVAERTKQQTIAVAETKRAEAETQKATAERGRQEAQEAITTVQVVQAAEREKQKGIIEAQGTAQRDYEVEVKKSDAEAYTIERAAKARETAATADAKSLRETANAAKDAALAGAQGERAVQMIPVEVKKEVVAADKARVEDVIIPEMQARENFGKAEIEFKLEQKRIEAQASIEIERAKAGASIYERVTVTAYTTMEAVGEVADKVIRGQGIAEAGNEFVKNIDPDTLSAAFGALQQLGAAVKAGKEMIFKPSGDKPDASAVAAGGGAKTLPPTPPTPKAPRVPSRALPKIMPEKEDSKG